ncbi:MAG: ATP synthase F1 subunit delta [Planctomycetes bacterium]|nr:ATP synthase F1 subunit delta [Planctomycetota bacterium]
MSTLSRRWARALFEVAASQSAVDAVAADLAGIDGVLADPELREFIARPELQATARQVIQQRLGEGRHALVRNLLGVLAERRRLGLLLELRLAFDELVLSSRGEVRGLVETAHALGEAERERLAATAAKLSGRVVHLAVQVKPELIGGIRLRVGNTLWDGSVAQALDELRERLLEAPLARAAH